LAKLATIFRLKELTSKWCPLAAETISKPLPAPGRQSIVRGFQAAGRRRRSRSSAVKISNPSDVISLGKFPWSILAI